MSLLWELTLYCWQVILSCNSSIGIIFISLWKALSCAQEFLTVLLLNDSLNDQRRMNHWASSHPLSIAHYHNDPFIEFIITTASHLNYKTMWVIVFAQSWHPSLCHHNTRCFTTKLWKIGMTLKFSSVNCKFEIIFFGN